MEKWWKLLRRALTPMFVVRLYYLWKHGAVISSRAEVDLAGSTTWGKGCVISAFTKVKISGPFVMGQRVQVATGCFIGAGPAGLTLGDDVLISPNCTILTGTYNMDRLDVPLQDQGTASKTGPDRPPGVGGFQLGGAGRHRAGGQRHRLGRLRRQRDGPCQQHRPGQSREDHLYPTLEP